jgi:hypothetical protein
VQQDSDGKIQIVLIMPKEFVLCRATANELQGDCSKQRTTGMGNLVILPFLQNDFSHVFTQ